MTHYLLNFVVYTCAMVGMIFFALFVYKKFSINQAKTSQSNFLEVEDCLPMGVRKQLYVVRAGEERFLVASDAEHTSLISKLQKEQIDTTNYKEKIELPKFEGNTPVTEDFSQNMDNLYSNYALHGTNTSEVLRNIISTGERFNG